MGWNHVTVTFEHIPGGGGGHTNITCYIISDKNPTLRWDSWTWNHRLKDAKNGMLCSGGQVIDTDFNNDPAPTHQDPKMQYDFFGIVNEVQFYTGII